MGRLILIRHAEAIGQGYYLGRRSDPPLSGSGREQAAVLALSLRENEPGCVNGGTELFVSPLQRTLETAELLFPGVRPVEVPELMEMDFGDWDGLSWREISSCDAAGYGKWLGDPVLNSPPGGETLGEFNKRVADGFADVLTQAKSDCSCLVLHGGVIRSILCSILRMPAEKHWSFRIDCASYSSIKIFYDNAGYSGLIEYLNYK